MNLPPPDPARRAATPKHAPTRRNFLVEAAAVVVGAAAALLPLAAGLAMYLDPLRRKSGLGTLVRVASLDSLPADGRPVLVPVVRDARDAWNFFPSDVVGKVYLRRTGEAEVEALNAACPHAGCTVDFLAARGQFQCPCHDSRFEPDGARIDPAHCPSPRDMDTLEVDQAELARGEVWVKFENFQAGKAAKIPEA